MELIGSFFESIVPSSDIYSKCHILGPLGRLRTVPHSVIHRTRLGQVVFCICDSGYDAGNWWAVCVGIAHIIVMERLVCGLILLLCDC